ncbi:protein of unknown function [Methylorubrum extorquens]|uniref:Uncharacterized protein n=1 Tax=Methylorubrum extorquens TaxID=408 RepID=A0A2N9AVU7_METEX|nr:protein of unknown function [Methylorubrum extorquens]
MMLEVFEMRAKESRVHRQNCVYIPYAFGSFESILYESPNYRMKFKPLAFVKFLRYEQIETSQRF